MEKEKVNSLVGSPSIFEKLAKIQAEVRVGKDQYNDFGGYSYRNAESILAAAKPICMKYNAVLYLTDEIVDIGNRFYVKATAVLRSTDDNGQITVRAYAREEDSRAKMSPAQITGSSSSFARKYCLCGLLAIDSNKDADDPSYTRMVAEDQAAEAELQNRINALISKVSAMQAEDPVEVRLDKLCRKYGVTELHQLTAEQVTSLETLLGISR